MLRLFFLLAVLAAAIASCQAGIDTDRARATCHQSSSTSPPLRCLIDHARATFHSKLARQSTSVADARRAYTERYKRTPPRLFDIWVDFALHHRSPIIDDFDQLEEDLQPFRHARLSKQDWTGLMGAAKHAATDEMLGIVSILEGQSVAFGPLAGPMSAYTLEELIKPIAPFLPDMTLLYNWYAEPRVLNEPPKRKGASTSSQKKQAAVAFANFTGQATAGLLLQGCQQGASSAVAPSDTCRDLRTDPSRAGMHGFFDSPDQFLPTQTLLPVLSRAKLSMFNDILAPNVCYGHTDYRIWNHNDTTPFADKRQDLYWRGAMTGLRITKTNWNKGHRHRFVKYMTSMSAFAKGKDIVPSPSGIFASEDDLFNRFPRSSSVRAAIRRLSPYSFNAYFSSRRGTVPKEISDSIVAELPLGSHDANTASYDHQFVFDVDGQSMSCRLYSLLDSNSVVFKQTIWNEWHDDRLMPWVHYIPIDIDLSRHEIPLYLDWFIHSEKGQDYGARMAAESRQWSKQALRSIDLTVYYFRIFMELADIYHL